MKSKLFILIAIFLIGCGGKRLEVPNAQQKETVFEDYFTSKKPALFEHYYIYIKCIQIINYLFCTLQKLSV